ncbi:hypothetical protein GF351_05225 [Candidatus Woesearchaeota archaeon]|nr:hypothetical protein [Candidatus Woesearchaeota archaeon]
MRQLKCRLPRKTIPWLMLLPDNLGIILALLLLGTFYFLWYLKSMPIYWDSAVYVGMAKYISSFGASGLWEGLRPVMLPILLVPALISEADAVLCGQALQLFFTIGSILMIYVLGKRIFYKKIAFLGAVLAGITPLFMRYSSMILSQMPSIFFGLLAIYVFLKGKMFWSGLLAAISFLFRFPQGIIIAILLMILTRRKDLRGGMRFLAGAGLLIAPFLLFNQLKYGSFLEPFFAANLAVHGNYLWLYEKEAWFYLAETMRQNLLFVFAVPGIVMFFVNRDYRKDARIILMACLLATSGYYMFLAHKETRYLMTVIPYVALFSAYGIASFFRQKSQKPERNMTGAAWSWISRNYWLLLGAAMLLLFAHDTYKDMEYLPDFTQGDYLEQERFFRYFQENPVEGQILVTDPRPALYVDNLLIPCYVDDCTATYETYKNNISGIVYTPRSFPCRKDDERCRAKNDALLIRIKQDNKLVFEKEIFGSKMYAFISS